MSHVPTPVGSIRSDVPSGLDGVLKKALAKNPDARFKSARELADALNRLRTASPEQTARRLTATVREDFNDARMADFLGVEDPTTLERAWRETSGTTQTDVMPFSRSSLVPNAAADVPVYVDDPGFQGAHTVRTVPSVPTVAAAPVALASSKSAPRFSWSIALGVAGLVAGACALVLVLRSRAAPDAPERVIVVDSRAGASAANGAGGASAASPVGTAADLPPADPVASSGSAQPAASTHASTSVPGGDGAQHDGSAQALSRVLARRQDQIENCFSSRAADVSGTPALSVRFEVDASGHVVTAHVLPPTLAATPLGQCIETVARGTDFGPQPRPLSFRIPMTARRSP